MHTKALTIENMDDVGKGLARIATLSAVDSDGDTYAKGAFSWKDGGDQWAPILVGHERKMMPIGKARVFEQGDAALAELHLNLDTQAGKDWHSALKFDLANGRPVQEWSYGYRVKDSGHKTVGGTRVREIKQTDVHEVSAVVRGAGAGTRTLSIKSAELKEQHYAPLIASLADLAESLPADPSAISATGLKQLEAIGTAIAAALTSVKGLTACSGCGAEFSSDQMDGSYCVGCSQEIEGKERTAIDTAIAGYLQNQARRHLHG